MVILPGFSGCLYWRWLPFVATRYHPSASITLMISRTFRIVPPVPCICLRCFSSLGFSMMTDWVRWDEEHNGSGKVSRFHSRFIPLPRPIWVKFYPFFIPVSYQYDRFRSRRRAILFSSAAIPSVNTIVKIFFMTNDFQNELIILIAPISSIGPISPPTLPRIRKFNSGPPVFANSKMIQSANPKLIHPI